jgi:NAD-dependent dihydropyrimidine dehydrogenase PreA subunit
VFIAGGGPAATWAALAASAAGADVVLVPSARGRTRSSGRPDALVAGDAALGSRQSDCQTCFLCKAYCSADALFVAPHAHPEPDGSPLRDEHHLAATGLLGSYRRELRRYLFQRELAARQAARGRR